MIDPAAFGRAVKRYIGGLPLAVDVVAMYYLMSDDDTPLWAKGAVAASLGYFIMPLDAIPDFIPVAGMSDDIAVLGATLQSVVSHISEDHYRQARAWFAA